MHEPPPLSVAFDEVHATVPALPDPKSTAKPEWAVSQQVRIKVKREALIDPNADASVVLGQKELAAHDRPNMISNEVVTHDMAVKQLFFSHAGPLRHLDGLVAKKIQPPGSQPAWCDPALDKLQPDGYWLPEKRQ